MPEAPDLSGGFRQMETRGDLAVPQYDVGRYRGLDDLRLEALQPAQIACLITAYGILGYAGLASGPPAAGIALTGFGFLVCAIASLALQSLNPRLAAYALTAGMTVSIGAAFLTDPTLGKAAAFVPVVMVAAVLLGWSASPGHALATTAVIAIGLGSQVAEWPADSVFVFLAVWAGLPLGWLLTRPTRVALSWAWENYDHAIQLTQELRQRQGELARLSKSLLETCERLERLNLELDQARRAAEHARTLKAQFAASVSHELRTPLNVIIGFSETMVLSPSAYRGEALPERHRRDIEAIYRNASHLSVLIDDVLELSQIDANRLGLVKQVASLAAIVEEAIAVVGEMFQAKGVALAVDVPDDLPSIYVDRTRIRQVLVNLLANAVRFTDAGEVRISAEVELNDVAVSVSDTGIGIKPEDIPLVFEEFRQIRHPGRSSHAGSGLGLTITKRFVELHGGNIWVENRSGDGATFRFTLPLTRSVTAHAPSTDWSTLVRIASDGSRPKTVLVLGDDSEASRVLERYLDDYAVRAVATIEAATRGMLLDQPCAVIATSTLAAHEWRRYQRRLTAADMHGTTGVGNGLPLISCPWRTDREARQALGVAGYLVKPISRQALKNALQTARMAAEDVLIVEDDVDLLRLLGQMVESILGRCRIRLAPDGAAALGLMRARVPDVLILDLVMPEMDGPALLRVLRDDPNLHSVPVVVVSAKVDDEAMVATALSVGREEGLSVAEVARCLKAILDGLTVGQPLAGE
jgi:signal transduction histidine kinase/CheY-like chemotaxis protein